MYLFKFEVQLSDRRAVVVVMGDSDREAMDEAEIHLTKHFIAPPEMKEIVLVEKRRANKGAGYVIET